MKRITVKVFVEEIENTWQNSDESKLKLLSHQEFEFGWNTKRSLERHFANLCRFVEGQRDCEPDKAKSSVTKKLQFIEPSTGDLALNTSVRCECKEPLGPYRCRGCGRLLPGVTPEKSAEDKLYDLITGGDK